MAMANFNKNLFVGVGGVEAINLSHFIGAIHGMERMMGKAKLWYILSLWEQIQTVEH